MKPLFLEVEDVLNGHTYSINTYGGSHGIRDQGGLESAVHMPRSTFGGAYLHATLHLMGAAYLFHICKNHPFIDGNKRAATHAALSFLYINGIRIVADKDVMADFVLNVASGRTTKEEIAAFFAAHSQLISPA